MTRSHEHDSHLSKNARSIEHEIEHKLSAKHGDVHHILYSEVHKLRMLDSQGGKLNKHKFLRDLKAIEVELHHKHLLPHMHLPKDDHKPATHHKDGTKSAADHPPHEHTAPHAHGSKIDHKPSAHSAPVPSEAHKGSGASTHDAHGAKKQLLPPLHIDDRSMAGSSPAGAPRPGTTNNEYTAGDSQPAQFKPGEVAPAQNRSAPGDLTSLSAAIARAKAGGRPLTIAQIGDSHVAHGTETAAMVAQLAANNGLRPDQVSASHYGQVGKTATYANQHAAEFLRNINKNTDLVVVSFGSNEAGEKAGNYSRSYADLISKVRAQAPNASIVMVGPTDGNFWNSNRHLPNLDGVTRAQQTVAAGVPNSAYIDVRPQMGSVASMRQRGLMAGDNLHLTNGGYALLGRMIADDIKKT
jgi:lysophospholipase L1-like esterase